MINELHSLAVAMDDANIITKEWHRQLKELPKVTENNPCFHIFLSSDGSVQKIEKISTDLAKYLRKWEPSNGTSFPAFNLPPLAKHIDAKKENSTPFVFSEFETWYKDKKNIWGEKEILKVESCLHTVSSTLQEKLKGDDSGNIRELIAVMKKMSVESFHKAVEQYAMEKLANGEDRKTLLEFLTSAAQVSIFLDLHNWQPYSYPIAHENTMLCLNAALSTADLNAGETAAASRARDAFDASYTVVGEPMPGVKLPGKVGEVKLRAMFHEHQCQFRYGLIDDASYPINKENRAKIKRSLEWLKEPDKEGKTWGMADIDEILFAYPSKLKSTSARFTSFLGAAANANDEKFEDVAGDVVNTLKGLSPKNRPEFVQIFTIRKMDKARSKVTFYRNYTTEHLIASAETWRQGCGNIPPVQFRAWTQKGSDEKIPPEILEPQTPKPLQIARCVNKAWKLDGSVAGEVKKMKYYQGIELLLDPQNSATELYILSTLLTNARGLVSLAGDTLHRGKALLGKFFYDKNNRPVDLFFLFPILGLLLYKQDCKKENYMEDAPYLIGQILKISDELHALYCKVVRKDDVPPQLAGNSVFIAASETPMQALSQLRLRMNPYISWAKQYRTKKIDEKGRESWKAGWYLGLYEDIATKLHLNLSDKTRFDDLAKAQVFIGYLAAFPKRGKDAESDSAIQNAQIEGVKHE
jgi:hypothetical protein